MAVQTVFAAVLLSFASSLWAQCEPLPPNMHLFLRTSRAAQPGGRARALLDSADFWELEQWANGPGVCLSWFVDPRGAATFEPNGISTNIFIADDLKHGDVVTITANVDNARLFLKTDIFIYESRLNPFAGRNWRDRERIYCGPRFIRGDADSNGTLDITDALRIFGFLFLGGAEPDCLSAYNIDGDATVSISDGIYALRYLFEGQSPPPAAPFPECGISTIDTDPGCDSYTACDSTFETEPRDTINEIILYGNGTFTVTWAPFETYVDYWGDYTFDLDAGTFSMVIRNGNFIPDDFDGEGRFHLEGEQLILESIWLGTSDWRGIPNPPNDPHCGHILTH